jgi:uncharacterized protein (TIGR04255 family)
VLTNETVSLETRGYSSITEFARRWTGILGIVATHFQPRHQLRIGLRYINEFRHPAGDNYGAWSQWLKSDLVDSNLNTMFGGDIEQTIGEIRTGREDGMMLLRHGFLKLMFRLNRFRIAVKPLGERIEAYTLRCGLKPLPRLIWTN